MPATNRSLVKTNYIQHMRFSLLTFHPLLVCLCMCTCIINQHSSDAFMHRTTPGCKCVHNNVFNSCHLWPFPTILCLIIQINAFLYNLFLNLQLFSLLLSSSFLCLMRQFLFRLFTTGQRDILQKQQPHSFRSFPQMFNSYTKKKSQMQYLISLLHSFRQSLG